MFLPLASSVYVGDKMDFSELKPRNRTKMAVVACLGGFVGAHNFFLENSVSGCIKIYLTLVAIIAPHHVALSLAAVNLAWVLFDLWQICFVNTLPEIRLEGSRKKAVIFVLTYMAFATAFAIFLVHRGY
jgi:TM2 domain-containing membrane protein YozV